MRDIFMPNILPPIPPNGIENKPSAQEGVSPSQKMMQDIVFAVVIVLLVGVAGSLIAVGAMLQSYLASKQATYEDLKNQVLLQNFKIDILSDNLNTFTKEISKKVSTSTSQ